LQSAVRPSTAGSVVLASPFAASASRCATATPAPRVAGCPPGRDETEGELPAPVVGVPPGHIRHSLTGPEQPGSSLTGRPRSVLAGFERSSDIRVHLFVIGTPGPGNGDEAPHRRIHAPRACNRMRPRCAQPSVRDLYQRCAEPAVAAGLVMRNRA